MRERGGRGEGEGRGERGEGRGERGEGRGGERGRGERRRGGEGNVANEEPNLVMRFLYYKLRIATITLQK